MKRTIIRVSGKVQGVYFRASAKEEANRLGISGIVKNEIDGSVYIEAEGPDPALERFIQWCKVGPRNAQVSSCVVESVEVQGYGDFQIVR